MTKITNFVWNFVDDCVISELDGTGAVQAVYTNEPQQYGGVISQRRGTTTHYHHHDALGSTRFLTDSSGNVTDTYLHDAWGNSVAATGTTVGRILVLLVSCDKIACAVSCLPEKLFGSSGFEPCSKPDHGFGVFAEPVGGIAFDSKIDHASDGAFDGSAANRHLLAA